MREIRERQYINEVLVNNMVTALNLDILNH